MTKQDLDTYLNMLDKQKLKYADRHWNPVAQENYDKILKMEENIIIKYHLPDEALADCHCSPDDGCEVHQ